MQELWQAWMDLDPWAQAGLIAMLAGVLTGLVKRLWPSFALSEAVVKQYLVAALAGLGTYVATGNLFAAVLSILCAIGGYEVYKEQLAKRVTGGGN